MQKLERKKEILTPKVDETGTVAVKRETVEVEKMEEEIDPVILEQKQKSRKRAIIVFGIIDLILFGAIVYQVVTLFMEIFQSIGNI
jgi:hypothetical protein